MIFHGLERGLSARRARVNRSRLLDERIILWENTTMKQKQTLTDVVRQAVKDSGLSQYAIGKRCGFSHRIVGHFLSGKNIRLDTAGAILEALDISVQLTKR